MLTWPDGFLLGWWINKQHSNRPLIYFLMEIHKLNAIIIVHREVGVLHQSLSCLAAHFSSMKYSISVIDFKKHILFGRLRTLILNIKRSPTIINTVHLWAEKARSRHLIYINGRAGGLMLYTQCDCVCMFCLCQIYVEMWDGTQIHYGLLTPHHGRMEHLDDEKIM